jgi:hypothetical protein
MPLCNACYPPPGNARWDKAPPGPGHVLPAMKTYLPLESSWEWGWRQFSSAGNFEVRTSTHQPGASRLLSPRNYFSTQGHGPQIDPAVGLVLADKRHFLEGNVAAALVVGPSAPSNFKGLPGLLLGSHLRDG